MTVDGEMNVFKQSGTAITFAVHIAPRASKNQVVGMQGDAVKIRLTAPPVEGKANEALIEFLAKALAVSRSQVEIVAGHASRRKMIRVTGITTQQVQSLLAKN